MHILHHLLHILEEILPVFFLAIFASALLEYFLPDDYIENHFKEANFFSMLNASFLGALIPICTCGMIPLAVRLFQKGLRWQLIVAFLVAGNACSIPALWLTAVMGLDIVAIRLVVSVLYGLAVAYALLLVAPDGFELKLNTSLLSEKKSSSCCDHNPKSSSKDWQAISKEIAADLWMMVKNFLPWIFVAAFIAALFNYYFVSSTDASQTNFMSLITEASPWLSAIIAFPFYFCAGADVPISQELLSVGVSLGTIISFMLAAPGLNFTSFLVYRKCVGTKLSLVLLLFSYLFAVLFGQIVNVLMSAS